MTALASRFFGSKYSDKHIVAFSLELRVAPHSRNGFPFEHEGLLLFTLRTPLIKTLIGHVKLIFSYSRRVAKDITPEISAEIVRLLTEERKRKRLSQNALAEKAGVNQSMVSGLEKNPWNPTIGSLLRIADGLGIDLGEIVSAARKTVSKRSRKI